MFKRRAHAGWLDQKKRQVASSLAQHSGVFPGFQWSWTAWSGLGASFQPQAGCETRAWKREQNCHADGHRDRPIPDNGGSTPGQQRKVASFATSARICGHGARIRARWHKKRRLRRQADLSTSSVNVWLWRKESCLLSEQWKSCSKWRTATGPFLLSTSWAASTLFRRSPARIKCDGVALGLVVLWLVAAWGHFLQSQTFWMTKRMKLFMAILVAKTAFGAPRRILFNVINTSARARDAFRARARVSSKYSDN